MAAICLDTSAPGWTLSSGSSAPAADRAMFRYAEGDNEAFEEVYREVAPRLRAFLLRRCPDQADDILQQTFLAMHRGRATFLPGAPVMPWAFAIARRRLIDNARSSGRVERLAVGGEVGPRTDAFAALQGKRMQAELEEELEQLPPYQREAFELVRLDGFTLEEAAAATGTSVSSMKARSHRALETLRSRLWRLVDR
ncbi:MAG TPA: RNA polymerase sigma factor [Myxococcota bacterium]|nr:RNA polymerase sigma factor [Myxococcota bacterium]HND28682.1 RNA polymerase sigma factor [Myxococcota bacterium]